MKKMSQYTTTAHIPFYRQMIAFLRNAMNFLDGQGREEVLQFIASQQNADGGFQDRGGRSDLYYSLFGGMMLRGVESPLNPPQGDFKSRSNIATSETDGLRQFIQNLKGVARLGFIEKCCLVLLQKELKTGRNSQIKALISLGRSFWKERHSINLSYRSFVLFLTLDAVLPFRRILKIGAQRMLAQTSIDGNSPCSEVAARLFLQKMMNQDGLTEQELLKSFACETGGFKAFAHLNSADILSTAVALFSLNFAGSDLRLLKPACLDFIQQNYFEGAFLSGDGDTTIDVEYTFYGLLALGVLAK
ncbi:MAG: prenyltransferase/squalene oxidase repeat-containing protein [Bacteroidota bacterium]|nr:prenyltransferase/squalene oxidase repeat-containing protein [Bacteroidota bacterium]